MLVFPCVLSLSTTLSVAARAAPSSEQCAKSAETGQQERDEGKLASAKTSFIACGDEACPGFIREDCLRWLQALEANIPTFSFRVKDARGIELTGAAIQMDGKDLGAKEGRLQSADPGKHLFSFSLPGYQPVELPITVREGEKNRTIDVELLPLVAPVPTAPVVLLPQGRGFPVVPAVLTGVAIAGGVTFAVLASSAKSQRDELRSTCGPNCELGAGDPITSKLIVANVALGLGVAALGVAVVTFILHQDAPKNASAGSFSLRF